MTLAPVLPGPLAPATPAVNQVLPFSRVPVSPGGPLGPILPTPVAPVPAPIPKPPPGPLGILPVVRPLLRDLADQPGSPIQGAPDAIDLLDPLSPRNPLNPFSPLWDQAPWNQPNTPASLVPPTEAPTGEFPFPPPATQGAFAYTLFIIFQQVEYRFVSGELEQTGTNQLVRSYGQFATPLGIRYEVDQLLGDERHTFFHDRILPSGTELPLQMLEVYPLRDPQNARDFYVSFEAFYRVTGQPDVEVEPELKVPIIVAPPTLLVPSAPVPIAPPKEVPFLPFLPPDIVPVPQPDPVPVPDDDPVPVIPLPVPVPQQSPELQEQKVPPLTLPANPAEPALPDYNPIPAPGSDPQTKEPRKLPPVPFDFCELDCLPEPPADPVVLIRDKSAQSLFSQVINFAGSISGQYSSVLPVGIASVSVSLSALEGRADTWGSTATGEKLGKYGKVSLVLDGTPIQDYMLVQQPNITLNIPFNRGGVYSVLVVPAVECIATITEIGERYRFVSVTNSANLPTIDASVLI